MGAVVDGEKEGGRNRRTDGCMSKRKRGKKCFVSLEERKKGRKACVTVRKRKKKKVYD